MAGVCREAVIDFEFLWGRPNEIVVKDLGLSSANFSEMFRFKSPYKLADRCSSENGINWAEGHIQYRDLHAVENDAMSGFAHL